MMCLTCHSRRTTTSVNLSSTASILDSTMVATTPPRVTPIPLDDMETPGPARARIEFLQKKVNELIQKNHALEVRPPPSREGGVLMCEAAASVGSDGAGRSTDRHGAGIAGLPI